MATPKTATEHRNDPRPWSAGTATPPWLRLYVRLLGLVMAIKFHSPDFLGVLPWLTWGRLRYGPHQGIFFGWLGNAFLAFLYYVVPRLAGRPVTSRALGWAAVRRLELAGRAARLGLGQAGVSQPLEWAEFPLDRRRVRDPRMLSGCVQFVVPLLRARVSELYVSAWYILGGADLHAAGLPGRQRRARVPARRPRGDLQRPLDSRRRGSLRHAAGPGDRLRRHPGRLPAGRSSAISCR